MKVAAVQMSPVSGDFERNFEFIRERSVEAFKEGADLVLFPELSLSGYTLDPDILKRSYDFFLEIKDDVLKITRTYDGSVVFGTPRLVGGKLRNSVVVFKKKREILFYDKIHLFRKEKEVFQPGEDFLVFDFKGWRFGVLVCYEIGFPEVSRVLALRGAEVILSSFAFGRERWRIYDTATKARAIENVCYLVSSSTTGKGYMDFIGRSRIVHPSGEVLAELEEKEGIVMADLEKVVIDHYRYEEMGDSHAYFLSRKPEKYGEICRRY